MTNALENTLAQNRTTGRADYHKLVIESVEHPEIPIDADRVRDVPLAAERTPQQLLADVDRVRQRLLVQQNFIAAEREVTERCAALDEQAKAAKLEFHRLHKDFQDKLDVQAKIAADAEFAAHRLRMNAQSARTEMRRTFARTAAASVRDSQTAEQMNDWKAIDLFASDERPRSAENPWAQPPSRVNSMAGSFKQIPIIPSNFKQ